MAFTCVIVTQIVAKRERKKKTLIHNKNVQERARNTILYTKNIIRALPLMVKNKISFKVLVDVLNSLPATKT